jgi:hypothetical protein
MASYTKQMQKIVDDYRGAGELWPTTSKTMAAWAIRTGRWQLPASAAINKCAEDLADAMREEYFVDGRGKRVRRLHPAQKKALTGEQLTMWDDLRTAPREHMLLSFQQNRRKIFWDCHSLKEAVDSRNFSHPHEEQIEMVYDFTNDLAEHDAADDEGMAA